MSQQYPSVAGAIASPPAGAPQSSVEGAVAVPRPPSWWRSRRVQLTACLLLAVAVRLVVLLRSHGMMDSDEAVLGIQAEQILRGAHPIYFAGQSYMGSWDAYLLAPLIALFGPSAWVLHSLTLAESLLLVPLLAALARRLFGQSAFLPAALLAAFCPLYVTAGELRTLGGYVETLVLGAALLLAVEIARRWSDHRSTTRLWLLAGLLAGLGLWIDVLIVYYIAAAVLWLAPLALRRWRAATVATDKPARSRAALTSLGALGASALGAAPAIVYAATHQLANVTLYLSPQAASAGADPLRRGAAAYLLTSAAPRVAGAYLNWFKPDAPHLVKAVVYALAAGLAVAAVVYALWRLLPHRSPSQSQVGTSVGAGTSVPRWNYALPLLLCLTTGVIFWRSSFTDVAVAAVRTYGSYIDLGGRYALPLATALDLLLAALAAGILAYHRPSRLAFLSASALRRGVLATLAAAVVVAYTAPYLLSDGVQTMQTPYWQSLAYPVEGAGLVSYLERHGIHYVWVTHWIGNVLMYQTDQRVLCADYQHEDTDRFPAATAAVAGADRPSFVVQADPALGEPATAMALDALGVRYDIAHFDRYWVITPTSRTVAPLEILAALNANTF